MSLKQQLKNDMWMLFAHQPPGFHKIHTCEEAVRTDILKFTIKFWGIVFKNVKMFGEERKTTNPTDVS
jgi:hypothetical protein